MISSESHSSVDLSARNLFSCVHGQRLIFGSLFGLKKYLIVFIYRQPRLLPESYRLTTPALVLQCILLFNITAILWLWKPNSPGS